MKSLLLILALNVAAHANEPVTEVRRYPYISGIGMNSALKIIEFRTPMRCLLCKKPGVREMAEEKTKRTVRYCPDGHWWIMPKSTMDYKED